MKEPSKLFPFVLLGYVLLAGNAASLESRARRSTQKDFVAFQARHPDEVFAASVGPKVRPCLRDYAARRLLPDGSRYGDSVRNYALAGRSAGGIRADMERLGCPLKQDVLREPKRNQPALYKGRPVPMWTFLCPDGGVVRVKPIGDPASDYRPQPHASKGLRYPYDSTFEGFADEIVKVDERGVAIPKSRADLGPRAPLDGWADDGHTDVAP